MDFSKTADCGSVFILTTDSDYVRIVHSETCSDREFFIVRLCLQTANTQNLHPMTNLFKTIIAVFKLCFIIIYLFFRY